MIEREIEEKQTDRQRETVRETKKREKVAPFPDPRHLDLSHNYLITGVKDEGVVSNERGREEGKGVERKKWMVG